jgi:STE24 endopeptidase
MTVLDLEKARVHKLKKSAAVLVLLASILPIARAQQLAPAAAPANPDAASTSPAASPAASKASFDAEAATKAYLDSVPPEEKTRSDSYFEGGYWLQLWDYLAGLAIAWLLLARRWSARMRDFAARVTRFRFLQTWIYFALYLLAGTLLALPLTIYEGFFREHQYHLSNQNFAAWGLDQLKGLMVGLLLGGAAVAALYAVVRRMTRTWWIWGALVSVLFTMLGSLMFPVFIAPLFNKYTPVTDAAVRDPVLRLARQNGIEARDIFVFDASKQSKRVSANVSGFGKTERISLNDNLLHRSTLPEVEAVMGHEMGHYVLHHVYKGILFFGVVITTGFALLGRAFERLRRKHGEQWGIGDIADAAGLPLVIAIVSTYFFLLTPVLNTYIRTQEAEADLFGINTSRQPDGMAKAALKLGEYRKMNPGKFEEFVFFDHPSGRSRIYMAMRWKAENLK